MRRGVLAVALLAVLSASGLSGRQAPVCQADVLRLRGGAVTRTPLHRDRPTHGGGGGIGEGLRGGYQPPLYGGGVHQQQQQRRAQGRGQQNQRDGDWPRAEPRDLSYDRYPRSYQNQNQRREREPSRTPTPPVHRAEPRGWRAQQSTNYMHNAPPKATQQAAREPQGAAEPQTFGEVVTVQATERQSATVIWLHGLGDTGHTWSAVASWLKMSYCRFIFPTAPAQPVTVKFGYSMPSWFDFNTLDEAAEDIDEDMESLQQSVLYLLRIVDREIASGVPPERIVLAGFAQGGVVALNAALQSKRKLGGVLALSTWFPRKMPKAPSQHASSVPIWFCHGTEDTVVKYPLGMESFERTLGMKLDAHFKAYDGLGHEYGSQEMVDVQRFLTNRIPANPKNAAPALQGLEGLLGRADVRVGRTAEPKASKHWKTGRRGKLERKKVVVGGVPVLFNAPWQYGISSGAFEEGGIDLTWKDCQGGTASMTNSLNQGILDIAVLSTDGAVAEIAQGGSFRIVSSFVSSPLKYGVYVSAETSNIQDPQDLEGKIFAISRKASLSHVMTYLFATQSEWNPREWDRTKNSLLEVGNLAGARDALQSGRAHGLLWEKGTAKPLVDSGEFRLVGECSPPWPSFVIAVREEMLQGENVETVKRVLTILQSSCSSFQRWGGRGQMVCEKYGLKPADAKPRIADLRWDCGMESMTDAVLDEVAFTLVAVGTLDTFPSTDNMLYTLSEDPSSSPIALTQTHQAQPQSRRGANQQANAPNHAGREVRGAVRQSASARPKHDNQNVQSLWEGDEDMQDDDGGDDDGEGGGIALSLSNDGAMQDGDDDMGDDGGDDAWGEDAHLEEVEAEERAVGREKLDDSSSSEPSYVPVFQKLDHGTIEVTGAVGGAVDEIVRQQHEEDAMLKNSHWAKEEDDEQISAILEKSTLSTVDRSKKWESTRNKAMQPKEVPPPSVVRHPHRDRKEYSSEIVLSEGSELPEAGILMSHSSHKEERSSSAKRAKRVAVSLRSFRDSARLIRMTAAKSVQGLSESVSSPPYHINPVSLFSEAPSPPMQRQLQQQQHFGPPPGEAELQLDSRLSYEPGVDHDTYPGVRTPRASDSSKEDHTAEFRHTLRKSYNKPRQSGADKMSGLAPSALFDQKRAEDAHQENGAEGSTDHKCVICQAYIQPTKRTGERTREVSHDIHVTTCMHTFHRECYDEYRKKAPIRSRDLCPICKTSQFEIAADTHRTPSRNPSRGSGELSELLASRIPPVAAARYPPNGVFAAHDKIPNPVLLCENTPGGGRYSDDHTGTHSHNVHNAAVDAGVVLERGRYDTGRYDTGHYEGTDQRQNAGGYGAFAQSADERAGRGRRYEGMHSPSAFSANLPDEEAFTAAQQGFVNRTPARAAPASMPLISPPQMRSPRDTSRYAGDGRQATTMNQQSLFKSMPALNPTAAAGGGGHAAQGRVAEVDAEGAKVANSDGRYSLKELLDEANNQNGGDIHVEGVHVWRGDAFVSASGLNVTGEEGSVCDGKWLLRDGSGGSVQGTILQNLQGEAWESCILMRGGPWLIEDCDIVSETGTALTCAQGAASLVSRCHVGGSDEVHKAGCGVLLTGKGKCLLEDSTICDAGTQRHGGAGVRATEEGRASLQTCIVERCDVCLGVFDAARITAKQCTIREALVGGLGTESGSSKARMILQSSVVQTSQLWASDRRPGTVKISN